MKPDTATVREFNKLDKDLRSQLPGKQCEAILRFTPLIQRCDQLPVLLNTALLKLADVFQIGNNLSRYCIVNVLLQCSRFLRKVMNADEFLKRTTFVLSSNDPVARALTLRLLGACAHISTQWVQAHHTASTALLSESSTESFAAIFAIDHMCSVSADLAAEMLPTIVNHISGLEMKSEAKLRLVHVVRHMNHSAELAQRAHTSLASLLSLHHLHTFSTALLTALTNLACTSHVTLQPQISLLLQVLTTEPRFVIRRAALRALHHLITTCAATSDRSLWACIPAYVFSVSPTLAQQTRPIPVLTLGLVASLAATLPAARPPFPTPHRDSALREGGTFVPFGLVEAVVELLASPRPALALPSAHMLASLARAAPLVIGEASGSADDVDAFRDAVVYGLCERTLQQLGEATDPSATASAATVAGKLARHLVQACEAAPAATMVGVAAKLACALQALLGAPPAASDPDPLQLPWPATRLATLPPPVACHLAALLARVILKLAQLAGGKASCAPLLHPCLLETACRVGPLTAQAISARADQEAPAGPGLAGAMDTDAEAPAARARTSGGELGSVLSMVMKAALLTALPCSPAPAATAAAARLEGAVSEVVAVLGEAGEQWLVYRLLQACMCSGVYTPLLPPLCHLEAHVQSDAFYWWMHALRHMSQAEALVCTVRSSNEGRASHGGGGGAGAAGELDTLSTALQEASQLMWRSRDSFTCATSAFFAECSSTHFPSMDAGEGPTVGRAAWMFHPRWASLRARQLSAMHQLTEVIQSWHRSLEVEMDGGSASAEGGRGRGSGTGAAIRARRCEAAAQSLWRLVREYDALPKQYMGMDAPTQRVIADHALQCVVLLYCLRHLWSSGTAAALPHATAGDSADTAVGSDEAHWARAELQLRLLQVQSDLPINASWVADGHTSENERSEHLAQGDEDGSVSVGMLGRLALILGGDYDDADAPQDVEGVSGEDVQMQGSDDESGGGQRSPGSERSGHVLAILRALIELPSPQPDYLFKCTPPPFAVLTAEVVRSSDVARRGPLRQPAQGPADGGDEQGLLGGDMAVKVAGTLVDAPEGEMKYMELELAVGAFQSRKGRRLAGRGETGEDALPASHSHVADVGWTTLDWHTDMGGAGQEDVPWEELAMEKGPVGGWHVGRGPLLSGKTFDMDIAVVLDSSNNTRGMHRLVVKAKLVDQRGVCWPVCCSDTGLSIMIT